MRESRRRPTVSKQRPVAAPRRSVRPAATVGDAADEVQYGLAAVPAEPTTMLVPIDAWNRVLDQLGNLHQAGQELAEARERAARAETESQFLRERLAELRAAATEDAPAAEPASRPGLLRSVYQEVRRLRR